MTENTSDSASKPDSKDPAFDAILDEARDGDSEYVTLPLKKPFVWDKKDEPVTEVKISRPLGYHMRGLNVKLLESHTDEMFKLAQKLLAQPPKFIDKMAWADLERVLEVSQAFLSSGEA